MKATTKYSFGISTFFIIWYMTKTVVISTLNCWIKELYDSCVLVICVINIEIFFSIVISFVLILRSIVYTHILFYYYPTRPQTPNPKDTGKSPKLGNLYKYGLCG